MSTIWLHFFQKKKNYTYIFGRPGLRFGLGERDAGLGFGSEIQPSAQPWFKSHSSHNANLPVGRREWSNNNSREAAAFNAGTRNRRRRLRCLCIPVASIFRRRGGKIQGGHRRVGVGAKTFKLTPFRRVPKFSLGGGGQEVHDGGPES